MIRNIIHNFLQVSQKKTMKVFAFTPSEYSEKKEKLQKEGWMEKSVKYFNGSIFATFVEKDKSFLQLEKDLSNCKKEIEELKNSIKLLCSHNGKVTLEVYGTNHANCSASIFCTTCGERIDESGMGSKNIEILSQKYKDRRI